MVVGIAKVPDESVPVTVMMYDPAGEPGIGGLLEPQAAWKTTPANSMQARVAAVNFPFLFCRGPKRSTIANSPLSGRKKA
jgi:hypothetical protein